MTQTTEYHEFEMLYADALETFALTTDAEWIADLRAAVRDAAATGSQRQHTAAKCELAEALEEINEAARVLLADALEVSNLRDIDAQAAIMDAARDLNLPAPDLRGFTAR